MKTWFTAHSVWLVGLLPGLLLAQPNPAAGGSSSPGQTSSGLVTIALIDRLEIVHISGSSMQIRVDIDLKADKKIQIANIGMQNLRVEDVPVFTDLYSESFELPAKTQIRKILTYNSSVAPEMAKWVAKLGSRVHVEGTAVFNGQEPGLLGRKSPINAMVPFHQEPFLVQPGEQVLADLKKALPGTPVQAAPHQCVNPNDPGCAPPPPAGWQQQLKVQYQGRMVVLAATITSEGALSRSSITVYRQGFRMANGDVLAPADFLDPAKLAASSQNGTLESTIRDVLDRFSDLLSGKSSGASGTSGSSGSSGNKGDVNINAWVPGDLYPDRISFSTGSSYPLHLKKRLVTGDAGSNRSDLAVFEFLGGPAVTGTNFPLAQGGGLAGYGECVHIGLQDVPQGTSSSPVSGVATVFVSDLPGVRANGSTVMLGKRVPGSAYGSVLVNRQGALVAVVNSEDGSVSATEVARAIDAASVTPPPATASQGSRLDGPPPGSTTGPTYELTIDSTPAGAEILVDDKPYGSTAPVYTPYTLKLPKGTYSITLVKDGYVSLKRDVEMDDNFTWKPTLRK
jgi:hypothetical protein